MTSLRSECAGHVSLCRRWAGSWGRPVVGRHIMWAVLTVIWTREGGTFPSRPLWCPEGDGGALKEKAPCLWEPRGAAAGQKGAEILEASVGGK